MNQERSHSRGRTSSHFENNRIARDENSVKQTESLEVSPANQQASNINQVTLLHQPLWFWQRHSCWSYFGRGFFWGGIISFTAIFSAGCGVALTKIDLVEQTIAQGISVSSAQTRFAKQPVLKEPVNILLVEVKSNTGELNQISDVVDESKTILMLRFEPQLNFAQVINIPADSRAEIPGLGSGTVADAYKFGGTALLIQVVNRLIDGITIDRYMIASSQTFRQPITSDKITVDNCDRLEHCWDKLSQVKQRQAVMKTMLQRLNLANYPAKPQTTTAKVKPDLDTNISAPEMISLVNFVQQLESDNIRANLLPGYTPGKTTATNYQQSNLSATAKLNPVAVQNTTDRPELGMRVVAYLRQQNFRDVYLVEHIPLKLNKTRIVTSRSQVATANYLKNILGLGNLKTKFDAQPKLILQIGEDALNL
ncbi:LCP family protein [Pleurocapsales cyanobacterium LEGE 10410]|nr:LCP family protein [Pleurocapsales cyanobacterium LEGE 10410]